MNHSIANTYQIILLFVKNILSYVIVFTTITMLFGYLHILAFLWNIDNIWLLNYIEYKTFMTWGLPISIILLFSSILVFIDHLEFKKDFQKDIQRALLIPMLVLAVQIIYNIYQETFSSFIFYCLMVVMASYFFLDVSKIVDQISEKKDILTSSYIWWVVTAPLNLILVVSAFGFLEAQYIQKGNFNTLAQVKNQTWGVLLNNNNSIILSDLNLTKKIKVIKTDDVDYFLIDDNKTIKSVKKP